ncbi:disulfide bond formation protein DsbB [Shewanella livingstonensis]|uniref:Disulfide bond formation protein B n=1 Tax=Shewanella livingstonensis TaxID=150120 RepID=A0A3G8LWR8_9GAMM|nr:disulfide bond formation protein DsbB [Shewanella livingstonensis]AZG73605.1 disulfide bond formation protein DsbB [Shewanella livingstonensis]
MSQLQQFCHSRLSWGLLLLSAIGLELAALFFQYGMDLAPCVMCIYIRVAVLGIILAGLVGMLQPKMWFIRLVGLAIWVVSAVWGFKLAYELNEMQVNPSPFATCSFYPEFPSFMPLDTWLPAVFSPTGMCSDSPWSWLSVSMAQWMMVGFVLYVVMWLLMLIPTLKSTK